MIQLELLREAGGMTQSELAKRSGVSRGTVVSYEKALPATVQNVETLLSVLGYRITVVPLNDEGVEVATTSLNVADTPPCVPAIDNLKSIIKALPKRYDMAVTEHTKAAEMLDSQPDEFYDSPVADEWEDYLDDSAEFLDNLDHVMPLLLLIEEEDEDETKAED